MAWPYYNHWGPGGAWGAGGICPMLWGAVLVLLVIIIFLVVVLINRGVLAGKARRELASSPAMQILDERYAKGEIDKQQYEQMKEDIR